MIIVDAGPLYAQADRDDKHHEVCREFLAAHPGPLIVPTLIIGEVTYLIEKRQGPKFEALFLADVAAGLVIPEPVAPTDWLRIAELVVKYQDFPLGTADASVVACAERLGVTSIATLDRRHFSVVRPRHVETFELLP
ncbi:MAG: type II toxin-antitoxin system VapC family toxin [Micromonosporaceae bacterium]